MCGTLSPPNIRVYGRTVAFLPSSDIVADDRFVAAPRSVTGNEVSAGSVGADQSEVRICGAGCRVARGLMKARRACTLPGHYLDIAWTLRRRYIVC
ncbi:hypothetical protein ACOMHN_009121 [Nucella lapillus]